MDIKTHINYNSILTLAKYEINQKLLNNIKFIITKVKIVK